MYSHISQKYFTPLLTLVKPVTRFSFWFFHLDVFTWIEKKNSTPLLIQICEKQFCREIKTSKLFSKQVCIYNNFFICFRFDRMSQVGQPNDGRSWERKRFTWMSVSRRLDDARIHSLLDQIKSTRNRQRRYRRPEARK